MADSLSTKKALADSLKEQLKIEPLDKISICEICDRCNLNRKSFYYHFEDKYDLINWIFDTEFLKGASTKAYKNNWEGIEDLCRYLYLNKSFYKKVIKSQDYHIFTNHLKSIIEPILEMKLNLTAQNSKATKFQLDFFTDGFIFTILRWLSDPNILPYDKFLAELKSCISISAET